MIIGGGLTGCEIAYDLSRKGKKGRHRGDAGHILKIMGLSAANSGILREIIPYYRIDCHTSSTLREIREDGVWIHSEEGDKFIPADSVILSVGYDPFVPFPREAAADSRIHVIGDASRVGNLLSVIEQAYSVAYKL